MLLNAGTWKNGQQLFLISFLILFFELVFIRWVSSHILYLSYFSNFILIASFVGMSLGCFISARPRPWIRYVPWFLFGIVGLTTVVGYLIDVRLFQLEVDNPRAPERIFFGAIFPAIDFTGMVIRVEWVLVAVFVLVVFLFIGLGQILGRSLDRAPNRVTAYTVNIGGSIAGILAFALISYLWLSPVWWFGIGVLGIVPFLIASFDKDEIKIRKIRYALLLVSTLVIVFSMSLGRTGFRRLWSPYYRIDYSEHNANIIVNGLAHQNMMDQRRFNMGYSLPYLLRKDSGMKPIQDVLIIGAGSGNDVAAALRNGVRSVDAVEIDPTIIQLGREDHPNRPYDDPRVTIHNNDGRAFLANTDKKYDLIIYALVDSLTLHSSYSSVRLENYLFTEEAFRQVAERLRPNGMFIAYNFYREGWLIVRIHDMLERVFKQSPLLLSFPSKPVISDTEPEGRKITLIFSGHVGPITAQFKTHGRFTVDASKDLDVISETNGFEQLPDPNAQETHIFFPSTVRKTRDVKAPTDDWPFVYLKNKKIPVQNMRGLVVILLLSTASFVMFRGRRAYRISRHFFFLGAGFMLIETMNVTRLAVLFGSTWVVSSVVFASILIMILLGNLFVLTVKPERMWIYYAGLILALVLNAVADVGILLRFSFLPRLLLSALFLFLPVFFASVIFATSFAKSDRPDYDFGSNIAGVVLGAVLESVSLMTGYRFVIWMIVVCYALSIKGLSFRQS